MKVPLLDLAAQHEPFGERLLSAIRRVQNSQRFVLGPEVERFEAGAAAHLGVGGAVGVSSGSDALVTALLALGIGAGDEVVTTPFSFFATIESILRVGAVPRFADLSPGRFDLDPENAGAAIGPRTRAILVVHLFGRPALLGPLLELSARHRIALVEDAAQAFGAKLSGRALGSFGALGCFSFQPTKPLGAFGDAGLVVARDPDHLSRVRLLRSHGAVEKHRHLLIGGNHRMDAVQAAVLSEKLGALSGWLERRREHARAYTEALSGVDGLRVPGWEPEEEPSFASYTVRVSAGRRGELRGFLAECGIESAVHYPLCLHRQPALVELGLGLKEGALPEAERAASEVLSLPIYPELHQVARAHVIDSVRAFFRR